MRVALLWMAAAAVCAGQSYRIDTVAGTGIPGYTGDDGPAVEAQLHNPVSVALDHTGRLYIADRDNGRIRRMDLDGSIRSVVEGVDPALLAGISPDGSDNLYFGGGTEIHVAAADGSVRRIAGDTTFKSIASISSAKDGTLLVADEGRLYRITAGGLVTEAATGLDGSIPVTNVAQAPDGSVYFIAGRIYRIHPNGGIAVIPVDVELTASSQLAFDAQGQLFVSGSRIWKIVNDTPTVLAGTDTSGYSGDGESATSAQLNGPAGMALDPAGNLYFADSGNHRVRVLVAPAAAPALPLYPVNRATDVWSRLALQWTAVPWAAAYDVHIGTQPESLELAASVPATSYAPSGLRPETTYYWRITARSGALPLVASQTWSFTTGPAGRAPEVPVSPAPANYAMAQPLSVTLTWEGRLASRFQVFLGMDLNPGPVGLVEGNHFQVAGLRPETTYYWRVVALNEIGTTSSALWHFTTGPTAGYPFVMTTVAGGTPPVVDGMSATASVLELPRRPAIDGSGNVYFIEGDKRVRRVSPDGKLATVYTAASGILSAIAVDAPGNMLIAMSDSIVRVNRAGQQALVAGRQGRSGFAGDDGSAVDALFDGIAAIALDGNTLYVVDARNSRIRAVSASGSIRTVAGTGVCGEDERSGAASDIPLCSPSHVAVDAAGNLYVYEHGRILKIVSDGSLSTFAGTGKAGYTGDGGPALEASVNASGGMAADGSGNLYFADRDAMVIRRIDAEGIITTYAGDVDPVDLRAFGFAGDGLPAARAKFAFIDGIASADGRLVIGDWYNHRIRQIDAAGFVSTLAGFDPAWGDRGGAAAGYLFRPTDVAVDGGGTIYVADSLNHRIRRITMNRSMDTIAGAGIGGGRFADAELEESRVGRPARDFFTDMLPGSSVEVDAAGTILFSDSRFNWQAPGRTASVFGISYNGIVTEQIDSRVQKVGGLARGPSGELYVSDTLGHRVIRIGSDGAVATVAGTGTPGYSGDGGQAILARLQSPGALCVTQYGEIFVAEFGRIRRIGRDGNISTVLHEHANGLALDRLGRLYVSSNRFVYLLLAPGQPVRIAGRDGATGSSDGVVALNARIGEARGLAVGPEGDILVADAADHRVRRLTRNIPSGLTVVSGQDQAAAPGEQFESPVVIRVNGRAGLPVPGVTLRFTSADRGIAISSSAVTNAQGQVSVRPRAGTLTGDFMVQVNSPGLTAVGVRLRVQ